MKRVRRWLEARVEVSGSFGFVIGVMLAGLAALLVGATVLAFRDKVNPADWLQVAALVLVGMATAIYAGLTGMIANSSRRQVEETSRQRMDGLLPVVAAAWDWSGKDVSFVVRIVNEGPGPALDIGVTVFDGDPACVRGAWSGGQADYKERGRCNVGVLGPSRQSEPVGDELNMPQQPKVGRVFVVAVDCRDVFGNLIGGFRVFEVGRGWGPRGILTRETVAGERIARRFREYP